ncbi:hypothetical protein LX36DRAFT_663693 [Colletotrichum falcatum]|nr:hypothetical protein LX36DRAFT_663693 [Colletotrichum falcatum]
MPNIGKRSPNCHLCRERRVKCDLARPQCQRCVKYGVQCPGYRDDHDLRFQHTDSVTFADRIRKKQQKTHPVSSARPLEVIAFTPGSTASPALSPASSRSASTPTLPLLRPVRQHWSAMSIPLVIGFYPGLDFLPGMFSRVEPDHCLVLAGQVFARAYMMNRFSPKTDYRELSKLLGSALASVQEAIMSPKVYTSDSTITAVWLLGNYELMMGDVERRSFITSQERGFAPESPWHIHGQGILSLMRARGDSQLYTQRGRQLFWVMHNMLQIQYTLTNTPNPPEFHRWLGIIEQTMHPLEAVLVQVGRSISSACSLLSKLVPVVRSGNTQRAVAAYESLLSEFDHAELVMSEWLRAAPKNQIRPEEEIGMSEWMQADSDRQTGPAPKFDYFWNTWRSARIKVHHMMILLTNLVEYAPDCPYSPDALQSRRKRYLQVIAASSRAVINTIPTSLGGNAPSADSRSPTAYYDAVRLIWPLTHVYVIPTTPTHLRMAAREALLRIGREQGIMAALRPRPGVAVFPPEALKGIPVDDVDDGEGCLPRILTKAKANDGMP